MASITIFAPAKINLFLHVIGRRPDGYHLLESLVAFATIGDEITVADATEFQLEMAGPYGNSLNPTLENSTAAAAQFLAGVHRRNPDVHIRLTKNLPIASGVGGGSSDAASTLLACQRLWGIPTLPKMSDIATALGADVPVCLRRKPSLMSGIGETVEDINPLPTCDIVLVNPGIALQTASVFTALQPPYSQPRDIKPLQGWSHLSDLAAFLRATHNDLEGPALRQVPLIQVALTQLSAQPGCQLARMSGSGATCFGLFDTGADATRAAAQLAEKNPQWWVKAGQLKPMAYQAAPYMSKIAFL